MRILVTGAAGFIGSHLVDSLVNAGHTVFCLDDLSTGNADNLTRYADFYRGDICNPVGMRAYFSGPKFDAVYHLAAQSSYRACLSSPQHDAVINAVGTINVLEACRLAGVKKVVFASSAGGVYGDQPNPYVSETATPAPLTQYGVSKLAGEEYIKQYSRLYGLDYTLLRLGNVYGPRQNPQGEAGVVSKFIHAAKSGQPLQVRGNGYQTRDFIYVGDVVSAFVQALEYGSGETYNIGSGEELTIGNLAQWIIEEYGGGNAIEFVGGVPGEFYRLMLNREKAFRGLHWHPEIQMVEGLDLTAAWIEKSIMEGIGD